MVHRLNFVSDIHCSEDQLGFARYVNTLAAMIGEEGFTTPFCIGIYGDWGSGKTSFMHQLQKRVKEDGGETHMVPVWFNPWRYEKEEHLIIPFLKTIEKSLAAAPKGLAPEVAAKLKDAAAAVGRVAAAFAYGLNVEWKLGGLKAVFDASKAVGREEELAERRRKEATALAETLSSLYYDAINELQLDEHEEAFRIVVFIDDLDRCLPEKAVELLEAIKLFLDLKGYLFIIGVAKEVVEKGIRHRYRFLDDGKGGQEVVKPEAYLDKMIQMPLQLPRVEAGRKRDYLNTLFKGAEFEPEVREVIFKLVETAIGDNPRALKRYVNLLAFTARLAQAVKDELLQKEEESPEHKELLEAHFVPVQYAKWTTIVFKFSRDYQDIRGNWQRLLRLQEAALDKGEEQAGGVGSEGEKKNLTISSTLRKILAVKPHFPEDKWLIDCFINLNESTLASGEAKETSGASRHYRPGDMVRIPAGEFLYGEAKEPTTIDHDYLIDVFPVTNSIYKEFLDANLGHDVPFVDQSWAQPYNWDKEKRLFPVGKDDHPVVLVSYEDALAFCRWRSEKEGGEFRLPSEEEWEKAARGTDGRQYPWGEEFAQERCNTEEAGIGETTPVDRYPEGRGVFDCMDMVGNVWEWTGSWFDDDKDLKVLRGGSWNFDRGFARCAARLRYPPNNRDHILGFRCARTIK